MLTTALLVLLQCSGDTDAGPTQPVACEHRPIPPATASNGRGSYDTDVPVGLCSCPSHGTNRQVSEPLCQSRRRFAAPSQRACNTHEVLQCPQRMS